MYYFNVKRNARCRIQSTRIVISNADGKSLAHAPLQNVYSIIWRTVAEGRNLSLSLWDENESPPVNETSLGVGRIECRGMPVKCQNKILAQWWRLIYIYIYISKGCSLFPSPFLSFLRLPIPARVVARMVIMGYHRVGASLARGRDKTLGGWGKYRRFTVVKRNSERIKIPSRFVSFQLRTTGAALPPIRSSAFQTTGVS